MHNLKLQYQRANDREYKQIYSVIVASIFSAATNNWTTAIQTNKETGVLNGGISFGTDHFEDIDSHDSRTYKAVIS